MALGLLLLAACTFPPVRSETRELRQGEAGLAGEWEAWADYLAPRAEEERWREIPWLPSLAQGLQRAEETGRPLLLWVMNGHPLGCT